MTNIYQFKLLVLFISIIFFSSCTKWEKSIDDLHNKNACKISTIHYTPDSSALPYQFNATRTWLFNNAGEPIKSIASSTTTGEANELFQYDLSSRLKYHITFYNSPDAEPYFPNFQGVNVESLHSFTYDNNGDIIIDSSIFLYSDRVLNLYHFKYDGQHRIIQTIHYFSISPTPFDTYVDTTNYTYNSLGNLESGQYDNNPSFKAKSKVLQFLNRDYSVNNKIGTSERISTFYTYGKNKLPVSSIGAGIISSPAFNDKSGKFEILYNCQ